MSALQPRPGVEGPPYRVPRAGAPVDLALDANEGATPEMDWLGAVTLDDVRRYPSAVGLEGRLAALHGIDPSRVVVTAGADDGLNRACRAVLGPGDEALFPEPGFSVMSRWIGLTGARRVAVAWPEARLPIDALLAAITPRTRMIVVTSPNNPTGGVATAEDLRRLSAAAPAALLLVDLAYVEFADEDLTQPALELPNALVTRTFSKALGMAGLRIGYALGSERIIGWLRSAGLPYPVSGPSLAMARCALEDPDRLRSFRERVREERARLSAALEQVGARVTPSEANFVLARVGDSLWWRDAMAGLGIGIRAFPDVSGLEDAIRIACPGNEADMRRLEQAIRTVAQPSQVLVEPGLPCPELAVTTRRLTPDASGVSLETGVPTWVIAHSRQAVQQARAARALPIGVGGRELVSAGAARNLASIDLLSTLLPKEAP